MIRSSIVLFLFCLLFTSCTRKKANIITCDLKRSDYREVIPSTGTIQAVRNISLMAPRIQYAGMGVQIAYLADEGTFVKKGDTVCIFSTPDGLASMIESNTIALESMEAELRRVEADNAMQLALLKAQTETNKAQMEISMIDSARLKFVPDQKRRIMELQMEQTKIERNKLQKKYVAQRRIDASEIMQMRSRIMMQKNRLELAQKQLSLLALTAPADGMIQHTEGYILQGSGNALYLTRGKIEKGISTIENIAVIQIPDFKEMQVMLEVPEDDYKRIENGQKVEINVNAAKNLSTTGKVKRKSLQKKTDYMSKIKMYEVVVSIDSCHLQMKPGLSASCNVILNEVKDTIVIPTVAIVEKDSSKFVYVADGEKFRPVVVETGLSGSAKCIIARGLEGNETIALMEPPDKFILRPVVSVPATADSTAVKVVTR